MLLVGGLGGGVCLYISIAIAFLSLYTIMPVPSKPAVMRPMSSTIPRGAHEKGTIRSYCLADSLLAASTTPWRMVTNSSRMASSGMSRLRERVHSRMIYCSLVARGGQCHLRYGSNDRVVYPD